MAAHAIHPLVFPDEELHFEYSTHKGVHVLGNGNARASSD